MSTFSLSFLLTYLAVPGLSFSMQDLSCNIWTLSCSKCNLLIVPWLGIRVFSNESTFRMRWPKYWSFNFSISPSNEHPGLISFRMDWLGLLAVQGTLKRLLQHHSSKASILQCSAFFTVQLPHPYMTTGKTIALTRWTFVGNVECNIIFHAYILWMLYYLISH